LVPFLANLDDLSKPDGGGGGRMRQQSGGFGEHLRSQVLDPVSESDLIGLPSGNSRFKKCP